MADGRTAAAFDAPDDRVLSEVGWAVFAGLTAELLALAEAGGRAPALVAARRERASTVLRELEDLLLDEALGGRYLVWRTVGRALMALGEHRLWAALFALSDLADGAYASGDELRFLARDDLPAPALPPPDWPTPWLAAPRPAE